ncbi:energy transducer TonB [Gemmatimonas sp.]|jgi:protein TonB|uniref:energy transducer TonB n=1 Tax=Gemmatimonas sp. TaxID=1962908 RepID=UPI0027B9F0CF|nr:energy transducer TonB [Gemmatimonas sp.]
MPVSSEFPLKLRAFESTRRLSWRALPQQVVGVGAELAVIGVFLAAGWLERWAAARAPQAADEAVGFLAPFRRAAPPPSEERLSFVGLGDAASATNGDVALPRDDGTKAVALAQQGTRLITDDAVSQPESESPRAMTEIEVDSAAALDPSAVGPEYPPELMQAGVQGVVYAQFVVDSAGHADTLNLQVLEKVEPQFVVAVKHALPQMKYKPAVFAGRRVNQLVQQAFVFRIKPAG